MFCSNAQVTQRSNAHGRAIAAEIGAWIWRDGWQSIQGFPFTPPVGEGLWVRTPPNFGASLEPHWERVRTFVLDPVTACEPVRPEPYSTHPSSAFYAQAMATHDSVLGLTDSQREIAMSWRDNPDGSTGLPSGHWALIANILISQVPGSGPISRADGSAWHRRRRWIHLMLDREVPNQSASTGDLHPGEYRFDVELVRQ